MKQAIATKSAPAPVGPYSQAIRSGPTVYLSGQIALDPATGEIVQGDAEAQARRVFENMQQVVEAASGMLDHVVKITLYVADITQFSAVNAVMSEYFSGPWPARTTVEVYALPRGSLVEDDAVMILN